MPLTLPLTRLGVASLADALDALVAADLAPTTRETRWSYAHRVMDLALPALDAAMDHAGEPGPESRAALERFAASSAPGRVARAADGLFAYAGIDEGFWYGGASWSTCCRVRSGLRALARLWPSIATDLDHSSLEAAMDQWRHEIGEPLDAPRGVPPDEDWWHG